MNYVSPSELATLIVPDAENGKLFWLPRDLCLFADHKFGGREVACKRWNGLYAGKEAFTAINSRGYHHGCIYHRNYVAHRVIWALHYGSWPSDFIDHLNGDRKDNRIVNLRVVSYAQNSRNMSVSTRNKSGVCGVYWSPKQGKWRAQIRVSGKCVELGSYVDIDEAAAARSKAKAHFGFTERHGAVA